MSPSGEDPPFQHIAIVGFGLIGGSVALAVRDRWPSVLISAVDRPPALAHAAGSGAFDRSANDVSDLTGADLVLLAAPVAQNIRLLPQLASLVDGGVVITDVGGTKRGIVNAASSVPRARSSFVGGHPIGGAERGGFAFARADLFRGRPWILTPTDSTPRESIDRLSVFVQGLGARPATMDASEHDRLMAYLSHLPQLAASVLMNVIGERTAPHGLRLAGRGLVDTTRLASSPSDIWRDVCASNADDIEPALDALIAGLQALRAGLNDAAIVDAIFERAGRWRAELMKGREG